MYLKVLNQGNPRMFPAQCEIPEHVNMCHPSSITDLFLGVGQRRRKVEFLVWDIEKQGENCATDQLSAAS